MIVELQPGCWIADGEGDPPRTCRKENAKEFDNTEDALAALEEAHKYRGKNSFSGARLQDSFDGVSKARNVD